MSFESTDKSIDLIKEITKTFAVIGYSKTREAIVKAREGIDVEKIREKLEQFIFKESCRVFNITQQKAVITKTRGNRIECLMVVYVMAKKHVGHTLADSAKIYGKSPTRISRAITAFNNLKDSTRYGASILTKAAKVNESVNNYKETLFNERT